MKRAVLLLALALAGCGGTPRPDLNVKVQEVKIPVIVPCRDARGPAPDVPMTLADYKGRLAAEPNDIERVRKLLEWAPGWMVRLADSDRQIEACAKPAP